MKPAIYFTPLLFSFTNSFISPQNKRPSDSISHFGRRDNKFSDIVSSRKAWKLLDGLEDDGENENKKPISSSPKLSDKDAAAKKTMHYLIDNDLMHGVLNRVLYGFNPDMIMDDEGNNLAHIVAQKTVQKTSDSSTSKEDASLHTVYGMEIIKQLFTSGMNPNAKNNDGNSVVDIFEKENHQLYKELAFMTTQYVKKQMDPTAEIRDQENDDVMLPLFDKPTNQLFNIASQENPSKRAKERAVKLIALGANLNETRYDTSIGWLEKWTKKNNGDVENNGINETTTNKSYYEDTVLDIAQKTWGDEEADKLKKVSDVAKNITDSLNDFKMSDYNQESHPKNEKHGSINESILKNFKSWEVVTKDFIEGNSLNRAR